MKPISILIIIILNAILLNLIDSVKNNKDKNELSRVEETPKDLIKLFNDEAETSVQKTEGTLKPTANKGTKINNKEKKKEISRIYYQNNKEKIRESNRIYCQNNREKRRELDRKYRQNNKEKKRERNQKYCQNNKEKKREWNRKYSQNNKEKKREWNRKYRERRKNRKTNLQDPKILVHSDNGEGTSNPQNDDIRNKGKMPIIYEEAIRSEEGNLINREEEKTETYVDQQNQTVVEESNKISENNMNQIDLNEKYYHPFDLNEKPEGVDEDIC